MVLLRHGHDDIVRPEVDCLTAGYSGKTEKFVQASGANHPANTRRVAFPVKHGIDRIPITPDRCIQVKHVAAAEQAGTVPL